MKYPIVRVSYYRCFVHNMLLNTNNKVHGITIFTYIKPHILHALIGQKLNRFKLNVNPIRSQCKVQYFHYIFVVFLRPFQMEVL